MLVLRALRAVLVLPALRAVLVLRALRAVLVLRALRAVLVLRALRGAGASCRRAASIKDIPIDQGQTRVVRSQNRMHSPLIDERDGVSAPACRADARHGRDRVGSGGGAAVVGLALGDRRVGA
ncbi:hypothetical protein [Phytohabitans aurantiacus]|uniref:Secreted protein n=1 Tax=Phytohabitans aurantiacus TaxID=3016789 RepID=A0ABQ5R2F6_9ACTN|nr:hypothetical protein [Phytohabitans aurantiacus]GLI00508.1 hypothetical protein Pa4123_57840 [Phytohabitans aurantiacus]